MSWSNQSHNDSTMHVDLTDDNRIELTLISPSVDTTLISLPPSIAYALSMRILALLRQINPELYNN